MILFLSPISLYVRACSERAGRSHSNVDRVCRADGLIAFGIDMFGNRTLRRARTRLVIAI